MDGALEKLVDSLLYEGYALYPYTPGSAKNATPTPFGIVYPRAYAKRNEATFDRARLECIALVEPGAELKATIRFLQVAGERHEGAERRIEIPARPVADLLAGSGDAIERSYDGEETVGVRVRLRAEAIDAARNAEDGLEAIRVFACVHNTVELDEDAVDGMQRGEGLRHSLLSTHIVAEVEGGRMITPLENEGTVGAAVQACSSENIWPCLGGSEDEAMLGAPIVLPDHARMAPESLGNLFDNTEIEEALLLHVQVLSDEERAEIAEADPAVRAMIDRADQATPEEILNLHGALSESDVLSTGGLPAGQELRPITPAEPAFPEYAELPPDPSVGSVPEPGHQNPGEEEVTVGGSTFRKGAKVVLRPGTSRDVYDKMLDGRTATIERIYHDYDDATHIAVTVDGSAEQELYRETGRYLFFKPGEVEPV